MIVECASLLFHVKNMLGFHLHIHTVIHITFKIFSLFLSIYYTFSSVRSSDLTLPAFSTPSNHLKQCLPLFLLPSPSNYYTRLVRRSQLRQPAISKPLQFFLDLIYSSTPLLHLHCILPQISYSIEPGNSAAHSP